MKRRSILAGLGSLGLLGAGALSVFGDQETSADQRLEPVTIDPLGVPSSPEEPFAVPFKGSVTVIDLFATWCPPCIEHMETLESVRGTVDDSVRFVSVTNEAVGGDLTRADVREWWATHGGDWVVGFDDAGTLTRRTGSQGLPHTVIVDRDGVIRWAKTGAVSGEAIEAAIQETIE